jgi:aminoglycoside 3-N-acetyltransferase
MMGLSEAEARAALDEILDGLGVRVGDRVMLGVDMGKLPLPSYPAALTRDALREREYKWCQFVLEALLDHLGSTGTLLVPAFSYSCGRPGSVFLTEATPSENGPFTEFVRSKPQAMRSIHPIFSLSGIGPDASSLLGHCGRAAFGASSPFARFAGYGVRFLCLGVELQNCVTYVHHLEQSYGCPHRYSKSFNVAVSTGSQPVHGPWYAYVAYRGLDYGSDISSLESALRGTGDLMEADWEGRPNQLAEVEAIDRVGYRLLMEDPSAFVDRKLDLQFDDSASTTSNDGRMATLVVKARE